MKYEEYFENHVEELKKENGRWKSCTSRNENLLKTKMKKTQYLVEVEFCIDYMFFEGEFIYENGIPFIVSRNKLKPKFVNAGRSFVKGTVEDAVRAAYRKLKKGFEEEKKLGGIRLSRGVGSPVHYKIYDYALGPEEGKVRDTKVYAVLKEILSEATSKKSSV